MYSVSFDIWMSFVAFLGLASLIICYVDYLPRKADYVIFAVLFGILGLYAAQVYDENYPLYFGTGGAFALGAMVVLFLKASYLRHKLKKTTPKP